MKSTATTIADYLKEIPAERLPYFNELRAAILKNLPRGFEEVMSYGMIGYVVPHSLYPDGYHCTPSLPLPFMALASQKNSINLHHMGLYANADLLDWFTAEYPNYSKAKLDMGKGCIRFKKPQEIPFELIGKLVKKISVQQWINTYEAAFKKPKK